jgi:serine/threonine-protein kinase
MPELHEQLTTALADHYVIERQIGAGGMAVVYLARDLKHERKVALKVLNPDLGVVLGADRFLSEIRVTANLQHPNLLPLFDSGEADGLLYYVMPYIEGESLRATLAREKQLPVEDALHIAIAVASALDYAHRHGVIHRDLKPENILLHEGQPLVADFGIALAVSNAGGNRITQTGLSLGTPQYMSPEQATGDRVIDGRTDIYSLGALLYEMLTGDPPHVGSTSQAIIARVLTEKPRSVRATRPSVPEHVEWAVEHALEKLSADRFTTAQEFADALQGRAVRAPTSPSAAAAAVSRVPADWRSALRNPVVAGVIVSAMAIGGALSFVLRAPDDADAGVAVRFELTLPEEHGEIGGLGSPFAISPDGRIYVYRAAPSGGTDRLYLRRIDEPVGREIPQTVGVVTFTFSPDGRWLAFQQDSQLKRIEVSGPATAVKITDFPDLAATIAWGHEAVVAGSLDGGLWTVAPGGGIRRRLTTVDSVAGELSHRSPRVLADGETVVFSLYKKSGPPTVAVGSLRTGEHVDLNLQGSSPLGVVAGLLVYHSGDGSILGVPFDAEARRVTGGPIPLLDEVSHAPGAYVRAALSLGGSLIYLAGGASGAERELVAVGLDGKQAVVTSLRRQFVWPRYSPDGRRIVVAIGAAGVNELWIYDRASQTLMPLTRGLNSLRAEWSPEGKYVIYSSNRRGRFELFRQLADGSGPAELIQPASDSGQPVQALVTPDARHLIYRLGYQTPPDDDLWYRSLTGDTAGKPISAEPRFVERNPSVSPDGRWVAYASNESASYQIYVRPFPGPGARYAVTIEGGDVPVWSRDGKKLYYRMANRFEEATVTFSPEFSVTRRVLFEGAYVNDQWHRSYDLSRDGKHFLVVRAAGPAQRSRVYIVHNWAAEVRARRGANR